MADRRSFIALDWVTQEIIETLNQALGALQGFITNPQDITKLRFCLTYLHQVAGGLTMVELHGAALLAKEIETLLSRVLAKTEQDHSQHIATIQQAIKELSAYVARVSQTHQDSPQDLLQIMNAVRHSNQQDAYSAADVFNPNIAPARTVVKQKPRMSESDFNELIRKLVQAYQVGFSGINKDADLAKNYQLINKVCSSLYKVSKSTVSEPLWQIASAIADNLVQNNQPADEESKKALKLLDQEIRQLAQKGVAGLADLPESALLKTLLYSVATANVASEQIRVLRQQYNLEEALQVQEQVVSETRVENKLLERFIAAILEQLEDGRVEKLGAVQNALALLQSTDPQLALTQYQLDDDALAQTLAQYHAEPAVAQQFFEQFNARINESRAIIDIIKEQIIAFIGSGFEPANISDVPELLQQQIEALNISSLDMLVPVLAAANRYVLDLLAATGQPEEHALELLADAISSVDYYLECVVGESRSKLDSIVTLAQQRMASLGYAVEEISIDKFSFAEPEAQTFFAEVAEVFDDAEVFEATEVNNSADVLEVVAAEPATEEVYFVLPDDTDEEILEIFIEEGTEVVEFIRENLPLLQADYHNEAALLDIRRSFHTLKGSGRMVGATHIGEFAWSVERMLNKVRDGLAQVTDNCIGILLDATDKVPSVLEALGSRTPYAVSQLQDVIDRADAEWQGLAAPAKAEVVDDFEEAAQFADAAIEAEALAEAVVEEPLVSEELNLEIAEIDPELLDIFVVEAENHIAELISFMDRIEPGYEEVRVSAELQRALHTLKGSAHMAGMDSMAGLVTPLEGFVKDMANFHTVVDADMLSLFIRAAELLQGQLDLLRHGDSGKVAGFDAFIADVKQMHTARLESHEVDASQNNGLADKYTALLSEALDCMTDGAGLLQQWQFQGLDVEQQQQLVSCMQRLADTASKANYPEVAAVAKALADFYWRAMAHADELGEAFFALASRGHDELDDMMDIIAAQQIVEPANALIDELNHGNVFESLQLPVVEDGEDSIETALSLDALLQDDDDGIPILTVDEEVTALPLADVDDDAEIPLLGEENIFTDATEAIESDIAVDAIEIDAEERLAEPVLAVAESVEVEDVALAEQAFDIENTPIVRFAYQLASAEEELLEIFTEEAGELLELLEPIASSALNSNSIDGAAIAEMKRIMHTLKGGARLAELSVLGDLTHDYESMLEHAEVTQGFDAAFFAQMTNFQQQLMQLVDFALSRGTVEQAMRLAAQQIPVNKPVAVAVETAQVDEVTETEVEQKAEVSVAESDILAILAAEFAAADKDTIDIFMEEVMELGTQLEAAANDWLANTDQTQHADALKRILHTIKGGARMAELGTLGTLTHDYESMIEHAEVQQNFNADFFSDMQRYQDQLQGMIDFLIAGANLTITTEADVIAPTVIESASAPAPVVSAQVAQPFVPVLVEAAPVVGRSSEPVKVAARDTAENELLALFLDEAKEQSEGIEEAIANFIKNRSDKEPLEELKRLLHTLKGGARMAGVKEVGDLSHDFETFIINGERENTVLQEAFLDGMQAFHEQLANKINTISQQAAEAATSALDTQYAGNVVPIRSNQVAGVSQAAIEATRNFIENFNKDQQRSAREPVKVAPELLENLINLAGESIIGRSRLDEQMSELRFSLDELDVTVDRLHAQLRRLEIETEAQITFRQEQVNTEGLENFDPLEMDRYSHMQQLSKSLIEAASDIDDLSATFTHKMRDMETLLVQQARLNTELQEGLMRCQMVPFSRMVPRLRRIVRQVAQEVGKKVEFNVENAEGELDRTILERMVAPLEHMLRNAVDHGIELPELRRERGKDETGSIVLALSREGGEVVLTLRDNGGGINLEAVRRKAIERGLLVEGANISDHEVMQFIMSAGFSTAQEVTQISGRGVGMDVVHSEIKQMGGSVEVNSVQGQGSTFTVRLPFTVSVNRALMVCIGNDTYAIPLNTIEGIVRVSPYELEAYYQPDAPLFEYAGQSYHLRYLGTLLHRAGAKIEDVTMPLPVILIRSSDYTVAVQVDRLLGSREIVVKSLGPQFGMVEGVSGATVLGDGSVVIILDMMALIRADISRGLLSEAAALAKEQFAQVIEQKVTTVMVVDDSVTVRKVTSRLLERYGLEYVLAKDGLDAITQLQEMDALPDVMLLDIEMPRMDGFEVVSRVRHNSRLQHIPIIMITSRTGDKHRERALSLGASRYLGKPFQERELLQVISELTGAEILQA